MANITYTLNFNDPSRTGLVLTFSTFNKISDNVAVTAPTITELGGGFYKFDFDMDSVDSDLYFIATDGGTNYITGRLDKTTNQSVTQQLDLVLGLVQQNQFIDQNVYDGNGNLTSSRLRTYTNSGSVGTAADVLATYNMTATYTGNQLDSFSMVKS